VAVALVVTVLDALTKAWARHDLATHDAHVVGPLWFRLRFNSGVAFSFDRSGVLVSVVTIVIAIGVVVVGLNARAGLPTIGFGLLLGGGVANVIDRLAATPHRVTDFVAVSSFPVFNLADAAITVGFILLVVAAVRGEALLGR
jgi:signal peptidase II